MNDRVLFILKSIATWVIIWFAFQFAWNQVLPLFGWPRLNELQSISVLLLLYIPNSIISTIWNVSTSKSVIHYHINNPDENQRDDNQRI